MTVVKRGGKYSLVKTVPVRYRDVEDRKQVWLSLHTDSELLARQKASMIWQHQIDEWEARLADNTDDAQAKFDAAKELAAVRGFSYLPAAKVAALPRKELLERIDAATDQHEAKAVLSAVELPPITVSQALLMYWGLSKDKTLGKSDDQIRRWKNPIKKAVKNFIAVVGDKSLSDIQPDDMPEANRFVLHIMAAVAEQEGRAISEHTKAALAAANARGVKLGWSIPERASEQRQTTRKGVAVNKVRALAHAKNMLPVIEQIRAGDASLRQIAVELNARVIKTARGGKWHATTVRDTITTKNGAQAVAA